MTPFAALSFTAGAIAAGVIAGAWYVVLLVLPAVAGMRVADILTLTRKQQQDANSAWLRVNAEERDWHIGEEAHSHEPRG